MANKQDVNINFSQGLNTKADPWQLPMGQFSLLQNSIFTKAGLLQKRNGFGPLKSLPTNNYSYLTTFNGNLTAIGPNIAAYNPDSSAWVIKGNIAPISLSVIPVIRNSLNQTQCDSVTAPNGSMCTVYTEINAAISTYKYVISDSISGQNIVAPTVIPVASGVVTGAPRVFLVGFYFVVVFANVISGTTHLQYISISTLNPAIVTGNQDIAAAFVNATTVAWDGAVFSNSLYLAYNSVTGGQGVKVTYLNAQTAATGAAAPSPISLTGTATIVSVCVDSTANNPAIYISFYNSGTSTGKTAAVDPYLNVIFNPAAIIASGTVLNLASAAQKGVCTVFSEVSNAYSYDNNINSNYVNGITVSAAGTPGTAYVVARSIGLASKAFVLSGIVYFLGAYNSTFQNTYFLMNGSTSVAAAPIVVAKLAWENGGGYLATGLPNVNINGNLVSMPYLFKDMIAPIAVQNNTQQTTTGGIYSQTGINMVAFNFNQILSTTEIASNLNLSGGFHGMYDGYLPVENNFFLYPENIEVTQNASAVTPTGTTTSGSNIITAVSSMVGVGIGASVTGTGIPASQFVTGFTSNTITFGPLTATGSHSAETITVTGNVDVADQKYYQAIFQWTDNQGNAQMSAGSIPVTVTNSGTTSTNTINIPTLRLTYKIANPLKIVLYRWSAAQQVYYQVTSLTAPLLNSTTVDSVVFYDCQSNANIVGNSIIYTTGGVVEDVAAPSTSIMTLFDTRVWLVDAEDPNTLWFSKTVIKAVPVEMSDQLTYYVAPNTGTISTTGPVTALAPLDDKLIIFKANAIYWINGTGPDNTGAGSTYSPSPIYITSTVGCSDPSSIVITPDGIMFQSDKGIWLLDHGLKTSYIGAPVEAFNGSTVQSAVSVPATNQVRQTISTGETLMYDYFYGQWGTFVGSPAVSSCIYQNLHSSINSSGQVFQETPNLYLDGANPVLMSFATGWLNLASLQGFERLYFIYLLGRYLSPHKLQILISYDFVESPAQSILISPNNFSASTPSPFGEQPAPFGSPIDLEKWKIHAKIQKCESFKIAVNELYDPSFGTAAGAGLTMSGIKLVCAIKKRYRPARATNTAG